MFFQAEESVAEEVRSAGRGIRNAFKSVQIFVLPFPGESIAGASENTGTSVDHESDSDDEEDTETANQDSRFKEPKLATGISKIFVIHHL